VAMETAPRSNVYPRCLSGEGAARAPSGLFNGWRTFPGVKNPRLYACAPSGLTFVTAPSWRAQYELIPDLFKSCAPKNTSSGRRPDENSRQAGLRPEATAPSPHQAGPRPREAVSSPGRANGSPDKVISSPPQVFLRPRQADVLPTRPIFRPARRKVRLLRRRNRLAGWNEKASGRTTAH
jgi:hypothetical protein